MDQIVQALRHYEPTALAGRLVVWAVVAYLMTLGALIFMLPAVVHRFFGGLASSGRINFLEMALRLIAGLAFVAVSPDTRLPVVFFVFGTLLALPAIPMMFLYRFHKNQAVWVIPLTRRFLPLMGVVALSLGVLIAWALV